MTSVERVAQAVEREVARAPVAFGDALERVREHVQLARHRRFHNQALAFVAHVVERSRCVPVSFA